MTTEKTKTIRNVSGTRLYLAPARVEVPAGETIELAAGLADELVGRGHFELVRKSKSKSTGKTTKRSSSRPADDEGETK